MMFMSGKDKDDYLIMVITAPPTGHLKFKTWRSDNNIVMSLLINIMENEIG